MVLQLYSELFLFWWLPRWPEYEFINLCVWFNNFSKCNSKIKSFSLPVSTRRLLLFVGLRGTLTFVLLLFVLSLTSVLLVFLVSLSFIPFLILVLTLIVILFFFPSVGWALLAWTKPSELILHEQHRVGGSLSLLEPPSATIWAYPWICSISWSKSSS